MALTALAPYRLHASSSGRSFQNASRMMSACSTRTASRSLSLVRPSRIVTLVTTRSRMMSEPCRGEEAAHGSEWVSRGPTFACARAAKRLQAAAAGAAAAAAVATAHNSTSWAAPTLRKRSGSML